MSRDDRNAMARLQQRLRRRVGTAITEYDLLADGDRVLAALSGGKDSWSMLDLLLNLQRHAPIRFEIHAATVDGGFPKFDPNPILKTCAELGVTHHLLPAPIKPVIEAKPEYSPCAMCSRLRRGVLYSFARSHGFSKIALGHNLDDLLETLLMNLFFEGRLSTMPLKLFSNDGTNIVIRPLATCDEQDLREYARLRGYPLVPSGCPLGLCSASENKRVQMKNLIAELHAKAPDLRHCMLRAMKNVKSTHLLDLDLLAGKPKP